MKLEKLQALISQLEGHAVYSEWFSGPFISFCEAILSIFLTD